MSDAANRAKAIFLEAVEKHPQEQWPAFLDQACGGDASLRVEVEKLLRARAELGSFHEAACSSPVATVDEPVTEGPGTVIGPYKFLEQIGEGGFGVVFMAEQSQPVRRKVALKVLKPGMDTRQVVARFEAERQALAIMDHPNIAKVHDGGATPSGRPYFVMELVKGVPITEFCDQNHLTPGQRLQLFVPVCQAVQHAHQKGIIHRDLKPSNILVVMHDTTPVVKVIDFGVAKALGQELTDKTLFTGFAQMIGTPLYMSPEQAGQSALDVDTRSDIYSLGVLLYELLTGTTPFTKERFKQAAYDEIRRIIREEEPPKPSTRLSELSSHHAPRDRRGLASRSETATLASISAQRQSEPAKLTRLVRGELDWIVMKCLEKDRNRRYQTANGLARDLERHLHDEPVEACPPSVAYRVSKLLRRYKGPVIAAAVVLLALVAGIVGTTWGLLRAEDERQQAENAARAEREAKLDAEAKRTEAEKQQARAEAGEKLAGERLAEIEAEQKRTNAEKARAEANAEKAIEEQRIAAAVQEFLLVKLLGQADTIRQADALLRAGGFASAAKPDVTVRELLDRAAAELSPESIEANFPKQPSLQAEILRSVGVTYAGVGEYEQAISLLQRVATTCQQHVGPENARTLTALSDLGTAYMRAGKLPQAITLLQQVLATRTARVGGNHRDTLITQGTLALTLHKAGRLAEALKHFEEVRVAQKKTLGPEHPDTLTNLNNFANAYLDAGDLQKAIDLLERVKDIEQARLGPDHPSTLAALSNLAVAYETAGKHADAARLFEQVRHGHEARFGPEHPHTLLVKGNLAGAYLYADRRMEALELYNQVLQAQRKKLDPDHPEVLRTRYNIARTYRELGKLAEAIKLFEEVGAAQRAKLGPDHQDTLDTLNRLAQTYQAVARLGQAGKLQQAIKLFEDVYAGRERTRGPEHPATLNAAANLAPAYSEAGRLPEAIKLLTRVHPVLAKKLGPGHDATLTALADLANCYWSLKQLDKSIPLYEQVLKGVEASLGRDHPKTLFSMANLGINYRDAGRLEEAIPLLAEANRKGQGHPRLAWVGHELAAAYVKAGRQAEAAKVIEEELARARKQLPPESPQLTNALVIQGQFLLNLKLYAAAEPMLRECLTLREKLAGAPVTSASLTVLPWHVASAQSPLGAALLGQKKYAEAEPLLLAGVQGLMKDERAVSPPARGLIPYTMERLIELYEATGRPDEAAKWRKELTARPKS
jgi:serine/threonine protein kinase/tetratricopeptide (TPR) repeat protein